ncbi:MAG: NAD-dependent epimerase/dehydratase family protein [Desulfatitalea sp.]
MFDGKQVLVTGGTGMIGKYLVERLIERGARVTVASIDPPALCDPRARFVHANLMDIRNCLEVCRGQEFVFHLAGIKGSPAVTTTRPASFFVPTILFNTNMMEAARQCGVQRYLFTSTIGVYAPAEVFYEDEVWKRFPSEHDRIGSWAKRMGELQAEAYAIEYGWKEICIVRPANVYGRYDNFDPVNAMVVPSLIRRAVEGENPMVVWGDGSAVRDFIHARDVADGMLFVMKNEIYQPVNLGSGRGVSIKNLVEAIVACLDAPPEVQWDTTKPTGDKMRIMDMSRLAGRGFAPKVSLEEGVRDTIEWFRRQRSAPMGRYNVFTQGVNFETHQASSAA